MLDDKPEGSKYVAFYKGKYIFVIKEKCVEQNFLFCLVYETQWDGFSNGVLQPGSGIRPGCVAGCSLNIASLIAAYICCILQILAIISFNPNIYTELKKNNMFLNIAINLNAYFDRCVNDIYRTKNVE
jgi:hypothetical protein